jgi:O-antigen/teichoic acid export membrane protein
MSAETIETPPAETPSHKAGFFRQSGWMMITAIGGGVLMFGVQILARLLPDEEYGAFAALIQVTNWMTIPALGLQMVFAQQAAAATTDEQRRQLVGTLRAVMLGTFVIWLGMVAISYLSRDFLIHALKLTNPAALWVTVVVGFTMLWQPIFQGLLQGRHNFMWLGWVAIFNGAGRLFIGGFIVMKLHGQATGLMAGVLIGLVVSLGTGLWQNLDLFGAPHDKFHALGWLKRVVPLTCGFGASTFIFTADAIVVQNFLGGGADGADYLFGGTLCRAIVLFTAPIAAVMFPKLVSHRASAGGKKHNLLGITLLATGALCLVAVAGLAVTCPLIFKLQHKDQSGVIVPLIPLFATGMVFLGMGNVLMNNLMAHSRFKVVPFLLALAAGYWIALQFYHATFKLVIQTFCVFTFAYLCVCALFNWVLDPEPPGSEA